MGIAAAVWAIAAGQVVADVWIFGGQSNMDCRVIEPAFVEEIARVRPDITIERECVQKNGSSMGWHWLPGKEKWDDMVSAINTAGTDLAGIVWYQGESEAGADGRMAFRANMATFFEAIREVAGNDNLPIIIVQLSNTGGYKYEVGWAVVRELQRQLGEDPYVRVVCTIDGRRYTRDSCPYRCDPDGYDTQHTTEESREMAGTRAARAALSLVYGEEVPLPPSLKRVYLSESDSRRVVLEFTEVGQGLSIGPEDSEIHILAGRTFEQWVPEDDEEVRLADYQVPTSGVELVDDSTIVVTLQSAVGGPLVASYANTAGGMESILLNMGIMVGEEPAPTFMCDIENASTQVLKPFLPVSHGRAGDGHERYYSCSGRLVGGDGRRAASSFFPVVAPGSRTGGRTSVIVRGNRTSTVNHNRGEK